MTMMPAEPAPVDETIGQRIRMARVNACMTQAQLGEHLGCSSQQIHKYERGSNRVSAGTLFLIAQALGQRVDWFFLDAAQTVSPQMNGPYSLN